jgi:hypothetical protein
VLTERRRAGTFPFARRAGKVKGSRGSGQWWPDPLLHLHVLHYCMGAIMFDGQLLPSRAHQPTEPLDFYRALHSHRSMTGLDIASLCHNDYSTSLSPSDSDGFT